MIPLIYLSLGYAISELLLMFVKRSKPWNSQDQGRQRITYLNLGNDYSWIHGCVLPFKACKFFLGRIWISIYYCRINCQMGCNTSTRQGFYCRCRYYRSCNAKDRWNL